MGLSVSGNVFLLVAILGRKGVTLQKIISQGLFWRTGPDTQKGFHKYSLKRVESPISVLWPVQGTGQLLPSVTNIIRSYRNHVGYHQVHSHHIPVALDTTTNCSGAGMRAHLYLRPRNKASCLVSGGLYINVGQDWQARFV